MIHCRRPLLFATILSIASAASAGAQEPAPSLADFARRNPAVAAALELPRDTPAQQFRTVTLLIDLGAPLAAAQILPDLLKAELDDAQRAALVREYGPARFFELIRLDPIQAGDAPPNPLAGVREFAQQALDAAAAEAANPQRIAALVNQLNAPNEDDRYAARTDLRASGDAAVIACFAALAAAKTEAARGNLIAALVELRPAVDAPLVAVLADGRGQVRRDAAEVAGYVRAPDSVPWLAALAVSGDEPEVAAAALAALDRIGIPAPTAAAVQHDVRRRLASLESLAPPSRLDPPAAWWTWNNEQGQLAAAEFSPTQLRTLAAARLGRALAQAGGMFSPADQRIALIRALEEAGLLGRPLTPAMARVAAAMTPQELSAALAEAVSGDHHAAALEITRELGRRQDASVLATADGRSSPLAAALLSPVRTLRFAALSAIMELAPPRPFPGSSGVADALWYFAAGGGDPVAVVAAPVISSASTWAGQLRGLGYDAVPAATGRAALRSALDPAASPRLSLVVLDSDIGQPLLGEVVYQLRSSDRSARVPILIAASAAHLRDAERIAAANPLVVAAPRPRSDAALAELVERATALADPLPPADERTEQAAFALQWIAKLIAAGGPYDELRRGADLVNRTVYAADLADASLDVLAALGTSESQSLLLDYASTPSVAIDSRRRAAAAFAASVQKFGKQLASDRILEQYNRYNASESADAATQQVLSQILDVLEAK